jgi:hypothetical protein
MSKPTPPGLTTASGSETSKAAVLPKAANATLAYLHTDTST